MKQFFLGALCGILLAAAGALAYLTLGWQKSEAMFLRRGWSPPSCGWPCTHRCAGRLRSCPIQ